MHLTFIHRNVESHGHISLFVDFMLDFAFLRYRYNFLKGYKCSRELQKLKKTQLVPPFLTYTNSFNLLDLCIRALKTKSILGLEKLLFTIEEYISYYYGVSVFKV